jgi:nitroreductase
MTIIGMNETLKVIKNRRSIRKFRAKQISYSDLHTLLEAALYAPNAMNLQKWHFTVIQNKAMLDAIVTATKQGIMQSDHEFLRERAKRSDYHTFHHAPTVILISADEKAVFAQLDCGAAAQNILLAAESLSINSCFIVSTAFLFASEKGNEFKKRLGIPDGFNHVCSVAVGYRDDENPVAPPRNKDVINYVK